MLKNLKNSGLGTVHFTSHGSETQVNGVLSELLQGLHHGLSAIAEQYDATQVC